MLSKTSFWSAIAACALAIALPGCSGGGSLGNLTPTPTPSSGPTPTTAPGSTPTPTPAPGSTPTPTPPGGGATVSAQQRTAAIQAINTELPKLSSGDPTTYDTRLQTFLKTLPSIKSASVIGHCVSAIFNDGRFLIIYDNEPVGSAAHAARAFVPSMVSIKSRRTAAGGMATELPRTDQARIMNAMGTDFKNDAQPDIQQWVGQKKYTESATPDPSIQGLKSVRNDGIFYLHTHGGVANLATTPVRSAFVLWTTTPRNETSEDPHSASYDATLSADLTAGNVGYAYAINDRFLNFVPLSAWHYCITPSFITKYHWTFGTNSVVFMNGCETSSTATGDLRAALTSAGAGLYLGWSQEVQNEDANRAARFFFDRVLGMNTYLKETTNQRPFDWKAVQTNMHSKGYDHSVGLGSDNHTQVIADLAFLPLKSVDTGTGLLTPSIKNLKVTEPDDPYSTDTVTPPMLTISGIFGTDPGASKRKVTVGGHDIDSGDIHWNANGTEIKCKLPSVESDPGFSGLVTVSVRAHKSNAVPLSKWHSVFTYTEKVQTATFTAKFDMVWRGDIHAFRDMPGVDAKLPTQAVFEAARTASKVTWTLTGGGYNGSGTMKLAPGIARVDSLADYDGGYYDFSGTINAQTKQFVLNFAPGGVRVFVDGHPTIWTTSIDAANFPTTLSNPGHVSKNVTLPLNSSFDITSNSRSGQLIAGVGSSKLEWTGTTTDPGVDESKGEDYTQ